ncbi:MAG: hypothetical protein NC820_01140 [Candidatus Omnitrophica bacterium]|nr:hypothetical protein [Candidatus Omnitrophota bacterium]
MKRILIFHISDFGGHKQASQNIEEAIRYLDKEVEVININGMSYFYPLAEKVVGFIYNLIIKHLPYIWAELYDKNSVIKLLTPLKNLVHRVKFRRLYKLIIDFKPHSIVATQAFPCGLAGEVKSHYGLGFRLFAILTDYYPHGFWLHPKIDTYIVACKEAQISLCLRGVEENKVKIFGIPISLKFLNSYSKEGIAENFGFSLNLPAVLIMGGGFGLGPIREIVWELDRLDVPLQLIVVCGRNSSLFNWFKRREKLFKVPLFYYGYVNFVNKLMDFADIIITKAGGITISEALCKGLGIIVINPLPGQEERNVDYLQEKKAVIKADTVEEVPFLVRGLLTHKNELYALRERAKAVSIKDSSLRIAEYILKTQ